MGKCIIIGRLVITKETVILMISVKKVLESREKIFLCNQIV